MIEFIGACGELAYYCVMIVLLSAPLAFFARLAYEAGKFGWGLI